MGDRRRAEEYYKAAEAAYADSTKQKHMETAYQLFSSACYTDPTWWQAFRQSGSNNFNLGKTAAAAANWRIALGLKYDDPTAQAKCMVDLGHALFALGNTRESFDVTSRALDMDPTLVAGWVNLALVNQHLCNRTGMLVAARRALELEPTNVNARIAMAFSLLFDGQYAEGFKFFEARFEWRLHHYLQWPFPKWEGEPGKTVFLSADQGLGDTLSFARFVELASKRAKYIHMVIQPALMRLFSNCFSHLRNVNIIPQAPNLPFPSADCWTTFVSLPYALGLTDQQIRDQPHIELPNFRMPVSWKMQDRKFHIGIAWAGSPLNDIDRFRNIPVEMFFELHRVPGIALYSLQKDDKAGQVHEAGGAALVHDCTGYISDVTDSLALLRELDMVICVESALGHIAALAAKECWIPYSFQGRDYRLGLAGEQLLWTPKTVCFRQEQGENWQPVFARIVEALREKVDGIAKQKEP